MTVAVRLAAALVVALLAVPPAASADNTLVLTRGEARFFSEDPAIANDFIIEVRGNEISYVENKDPQGTNTFPVECRPGRTEGSIIREILCPKSAVKSNVVEPGPDSDSVKYLVNDIPGAVVGATGLDTITTAGAPDELAGEQGNDTLNAGAGNDVVDGGDGNDTLDGGDGDDKITGGPGIDTIRGGAGNDSISAADGLADKIDCGDGTDTVLADEQDELVGCESVERANVAAPVNQPAGDDTTKPSLSASALDHQSVRRRSVTFVVTCNEKSIVQAAGFVQAGPSTEKLKLKTANITVAGGGVKMKLGFNKRQTKAIRKALARRKKPRVRIVVSCVDDAGNTSRAKRFFIHLTR